MSDTAEDSAPGPAELEVPEIVEERAGPVTSEDLAELLAQEKAARTAAEDRAKRETEARERAERERDEAHGTAHTAVDARVRAEEVAVETAISNARSEADRLEEQVTQLQVQGNFAEATKLMRKFASAEVRISQLEGRKEQIAQFKAQPRPQPVQQSGVDLSQYSTAQREWIARNPEFKSDSRFQASVTAAHFAAVRDGIQVDTPEYFDFIDQQVRPEPAEQAAHEDAPRRPAAPTLAVARRAPAAPNTTRAGLPRLSPEEVEIAVMTADVTGDSREDAIKKYALNKQRLKQQGAM